MILFSLLSPCAISRTARACGELTGDDLELRRALEDAPDDALAALAAALPDLTPAAADPATVARQALALVARDASEERRALVEEALTAPAPETLTSTLEVIGVLSLAVFALKSRVEIAYDKKKGFSFHLRKDASSDTLVRSVLSGLLSLGRK